jgi:hypothetical protein
MIVLLKKTIVLGSTSNVLNVLRKINAFGAMLRQSLHGPITRAPKIIVLLKKTIVLSSNSNVLYVLRKINALAPAISELRYAKVCMDP